MQEIHSKDVSFVVQGPISRPISHGTEEVLESIRFWFPKSKIILSTWQDQIVTGLSYDVLVQSEDPGDLTPTGYKPSNINRQLVSTKAGLAKVETAFCVKTRTDIKFVSGDLFKHFRKYDLENEPSDFKFFKNRIISLNTTSFNVRNKVSIPFAICDFLYAGNTEDIIKLFGAPLCNASEFDYFLRHDKPENDPYPEFISKNSPETYIWKNIVRAHVHLEDSNYYETSEDLKLLSEKVLVSNTVLGNFMQLGVRSTKHKLPFVLLPYLYLNKDWCKLYSRYISPITIPHWDSEYPYLALYSIRELVKVIAHKLRLRRIN